MMRCRMVSLIIRSRIADIHFRIDTQSECPLESPAETEPVQELVQRVKFRMQLYPMHCRRTSESESVRTIRSDHQIKGRRSDFLCWVCQGRGQLIKNVRTQLLHLLTNFSHRIQTTSKERLGRRTEKRLRQQDKENLEEFVGSC